MTIKCPICGKILKIKDTWIDQFEYDFLSISPGYTSYSVKCDECGYWESNENLTELKDKIRRISKQPECNPGMKIVSEYLERTLGKRPEIPDIIKMLGNLKGPKSL